MDDGVSGIGSGSGKVDVGNEEDNIGEVEESLIRLRSFCNGALLIGDSESM